MLKPLGGANHAPTWGKARDCMGTLWIPGPPGGYVPVLQQELAVLDLVLGAGDGDDPVLGAL